MIIEQTKRVFVWTFRQFAKRCSHQSFTWGGNKCRINRFKPCLSKTCPEWCKYRVYKEVKDVKE